MRVRGSDAKRDKCRAQVEKGALSLVPDEGDAAEVEKTEPFYVPR